MNANFASNALDLTPALEAVAGEGYSVRRIDGPDERRDIVKKTVLFSQKLKHQAFCLAQIMLERDNGFALQAAATPSQKTPTEYLLDIDGKVTSYTLMATPAQVESVPLDASSPLYVITGPALSRLREPRKLVSELFAKNVTFFHSYQETANRTALVIGQADACDLCVAGDANENMHLREWQNGRKQLIAETLNSYREYCEAPGVVGRVVNFFWNRPAKASHIPA